MAILSAIIDACVLINAPVRDTLLRAAEYDLLRVHWSSSILEETERNLIQKRKVPAAKARKLIKQLKLAFPEALIKVPAKLIDAMPNSRKDRHVAAAAVVAETQVIITFDIDGFLHLEAYGIKPQHPDEYLQQFLYTDRPTIETILIEQAQDIGWELNALLTNLQKHVPQFINAIRK